MGQEAATRLLAEHPPTAGVDVNPAYVIVQFFLAVTIVAFVLLILFALASRRGRH
jgi:hypothetical protein